jgi:hypothetical protein
MWEIMMDETEWVATIFRTRKDAGVWIRETLKEKFGIESLALTAGF